MNDRRYQKLVDGMAEDFAAIAMGRENQAMLHAVARFLLGVTKDSFFEDNPPLAERIDRIVMMLGDVMRAESGIKKRPKS